MNSFRISQTPTTGLRPVGSSSERSYTQLISVLTSELGVEYAEIFAEPVASEAGHGIDWFVDFDTPARRLDELEAPERAEVETRLGNIIEKITALANRFDAEGTDHSRAIARGLRAAVQIPEPSYIWVSENRIAITAWGYQAEAQADAEHSLRGWVPVRQTPKPAVADAPPAQAMLTPPATVSPAAAAEIAPVKAQSQGSGLAWLLWLMTLMLTLAVFYLLLSACEIAPFGYALTISSLTIDRCPTLEMTSNAEAGQNNLRQQELLSQTQKLERRLAEKRLHCRLENIQEIRRNPLTGPEARDKIDRQVEEAGGQKGELQFSLSWQGRSDMDLIVRCPNRRLIFYKSNFREGCGGGRLDVDANSKATNTTETPVENIRWETTPPPGRYEVYVKLFKRNDDNRLAIPYRLQIRKQGGVNQHDGQVVKAVASTNLDNAQPVLVVDYP